MPPFREPPALRLERVANFRDLGGHRTRDGRRVRGGRLFRSGHLGHATDADRETLGRLGLRQVFDFRTAADVEADGPDRLPPAVGHVRLPMPDPAHGEDIRRLIRDNEGSDGLERVFGGGRAAAMMERAAAAMVTLRSEPFAVFLGALASEDVLPALFHCSAGKDRAGWAASIVLLLLGVSEEDVLEQYLLSNREIESIRARLRSSARPEWGDLLKPLVEVRPSYFEASLRAVRETYGSFDAYLSDGLRIGAAEQDALRERLLE